jgi:hypothetical protein
MIKYQKCLLSFVKILNEVLTISFEFVYIRVSFCQSQYV